MGKETKQKEKKKWLSFRLIAVTVVLIIFSISAYITCRAEYLKIRDIDLKYVSVFKTNFYMKVGMFAFVMIITYLIFYINNKVIKKGLKKFFDEENRV